MHFSILVLGASLASAQIARPFSQGRDQLDYLQQLNAVPRDDQDQNQNQNQDQYDSQNANPNYGGIGNGQGVGNKGNVDIGDYGLSHHAPAQDESQHANPNYGGIGNGQGVGNKGNVDIGDYGLSHHAPAQDESENANPNYGGIQNGQGYGNKGNVDYEDYEDNEDNGPSHHVPAHVQDTFPAPVAHSTFVVRPSPAPIASPHAQTPASGYAYNYPSPDASGSAARPHAPTVHSAAVSQAAPTQAPAPPHPHQEAPVHHSPAQPAPAPAPETRGSQAAPVDQHNDLSQAQDPREHPAGPVLVPHDVPVGASGDLAPVDSMAPGTNVAPVSFDDKIQYGKDEGNTFCTGLCFANESDAHCAKPYVSFCLLLSFVFTLGKSPGVP
ncbi:hypothetical protein N7461_007501 [Penicillium sp. DV-2018c]|nr:hypothetical protein N7461_007501 [Penicillium sp. DV-2018c]